MVDNGNRLGLSPSRNVSSLRLCNSHLTVDSSNSVAVTQVTAIVPYHKRKWKTSAGIATVAAAVVHKSKHLSRMLNMKILITYLTIIYIEITQPRKDVV